MAGSGMFIFGGLVSGSKGGNLQSFYRCELNINQNAPSHLFQWEKIKADLPRPRDSHSCIKVRYSLSFILTFVALDTQLYCDVRGLWQREGQILQRFKQV